MASSPGGRSVGRTVLRIFSSIYLRIKEDKIHPEVTELYKGVQTGLPSGLQIDSEGVHLEYFRRGRIARGPADLTAMAPTGAPRLRNALSVLLNCNGKSQGAKSDK